MQKSALERNGRYIPGTPWNTATRVSHWFIAASMAGAAFLTVHGGAGHAALGWIALGALSFKLFRPGEAHPPGPALWLVTASVLGVNLSGLLAPDGVIHLGATLVTLVLAAFYCATVLFESLQRMLSRAAV